MSCKGKRKLSRKEYAKHKASQSTHKLDGDDLVAVAKETKSWFPELRKRFQTIIDHSITGTVVFADFAAVQQAQLAKSSLEQKTIKTAAAGDMVEPVLSANAAAAVDIKTDGAIATVKAVTTLSTSPTPTIDTKTPMADDNKACTADDKKACTAETDNLAGIVQVIKSDIIDCAQYMRSKGYNPCVLNLASQFKPGGGFETGATAQEEELFRRSTYSLALVQPDILKHYPLNGLKAIYSPDVVVFRESRQKHYELYGWDWCINMAFVAMPAIRKPKLVTELGTGHGQGPDRLGSAVTGEFRLNAVDEALMLDKIRMIFSIAKLYKHDCLVLSALGCGAYGNPPQHVARLFKQAIHEFKGVFKKIVFAILPDRNDRGNFDAFNQQLLGIVAKK